MWIWENIVLKREKYFYWSDFVFWKYYSKWLILVGEIGRLVVWFFDKFKIYFLKLKMLNWNEYVRNY